MEGERERQTASLLLKHTALRGGQGIEPRSSLDLCTW